MAMVSTSVNNCMSTHIVLPGLFLIHKVQNMLYFLQALFNRGGYCTINQCLISYKLKPKRVVMIGEEGNDVSKCPSDCD